MLQIVQCVNANKSEHNDRICNKSEHNDRICNKSEHNDIKSILLTHILMTTHIMSVPVKGYSRNT